MKIPKEILDKYNVYNILIETSEDIIVYKTFLSQTDFEIIKGFESLLDDPVNFLTKIIELSEELKEISDYRKIAREEILKSNM